jgi:Chlorophyll A-B binding protein
LLFHPSLWLLVAFLLILLSEVTAWNECFSVSLHRRTLENTKLWGSRMGRNWNDVPVAIKDELGCSPTLTVLFNRPEPFFFDPFNLATDENFAIFREAELKHSRVAMVAVVSCILSTVSKEIEKSRQAGDFEKLWLGMISFFKSPTATVLDPNKTVVKIPVYPQHIIPLPSPWNLLQDWSVWDYARMIVVCGIVETFVWVQMDAQDMPGDYSVGYWGIRDKGLHERSLACELENGRLAMIVMLYYISMDAWKVFGQSIFQ